MSKPFALNRLPSSVRKELLTRRAEMPGLTLDDHFTWLTSQGHQVSRSAIYRFLNAHDSEQENAQKPDVQSIRLGCLMVASGLCIPGDKSTLISTAEELLNWVNEEPKAASA